MKVTRHLDDACVRLVFEGRLDASWADAAAIALDDAIRLGRTRIELDLAAVSFITSVGIGAIVRAHARFRAVKGTLAIVALNDAMREMLRIARLDMLIDRAAPAPMAHVAAAIAFGGAMRGGLEPCAPSDMRASAEFVREARVTLGIDTVALGHFALANDLADARGLYGEGLAAGGTVAVAPARAPRPDCLASAGDAALAAGDPASAAGVDASAAGVASFIARDGLVVRGSPSFRGFFERSPIDRLSLRMFAQALVEATGGPLAFVAIGESGGAFGAWARESPDLWTHAASDMSPDEMRAALRFAGEPMHAGESIAVVAVACPHARRGELDPAVADALVDAGPLLLHAHVATVSYRPVTRATTDVSAAGALLAEQPLRAVMHALHDDRAGHETALVRGAVWVMRLGGTP